MFAQRKALENSEKSLSEFIPYSAVIAPGVVICREGDLVATVKISGKVFEAVSNEALQRDAERQNNFLKVMASASSTDEMSLKVNSARCSRRTFCAGREFEQPFCQRLCSRLQP